MPATEHVLLVNPSAGGGRGRRRLPKAQRALAEHGIEPRIVETSGIDDGREQALVAARRGANVLVMSGDGLVGQVGGALAGSGARMGVIPGGRGNDLARVLGIPTDPELAAAVIARGETRMIDVGVIDGARFLCIASLGFDSAANELANEARLVRGPLVYLYAAIRALATWRPARFTVSVDGESRSLSGWSVIVANSKAYGGGMFVAPEAELDDGQLDVVTISGHGRMRFLWNLPSVFRGTHLSDPRVELRRGAVVEVDADRPFTVFADGDPIAELPCRVSLLPASLEVFAPSR